MVVVVAFLPTTSPTPIQRANMDEPPSVTYLGLDLSTQQVKTTATTLRRVH